MVAVQNNNAGNFNFKFKRGDTSDLKSNEPLNETKIQPEGAEVKRAVVWFLPSDGFLTFIELFAKDDRKLLEAGVPLSER